MKYNNIIKTLFATIMMVFSTACTDDFVDREPVYSIDSETYFNSETDYYNALVGAYDLLHATYVNQLIGEFASDNSRSGGGDANDVIGYQQIDDMIHTPVNDDLKILWDLMYSGVNRANYILEFKDKIDFEGKEMIIAEARFLRAYYNFELVKFFGAIPLKIDARFNIGDETIIPRSPVSEVYKLIEEDLIFAVSTLNYTAPQVGRVTKGAAQGLLGKAYLYQDKFLEAANIFESLIQSGPYDLEQDYSIIFETEGENGVESVFEVQYTDVEGADYQCLWCAESNVAAGFSGVRAYKGPLFTEGNSFNVLTQDVVDEFEEGDIRKDVAILDIVAWAAQEGATYGEGYKHTGYFNRKYLPRDTDLGIGDPILTHGNNYRSIRFSDVLLMAAEAYNRGGISDDKAKTYLNRVRERAILDPVNSTGAALTDAIYHERRVELVGEGHRFFDLVRTGNGSKIDGFTNNKHEVFPIPFEEIQFSSGNWSQNLNY